MKTRTTKARTFEESLSFIREGFLRLSLDEQREYLDSLRRLAGRVEDAGRLRELIRLERRLEIELSERFEEWLEVEMKEVSDG